MSVQAFRINTPTIVHDTIDDEVIIIHLETGAYYSLDGAGVIVWKLLDEGKSVSRIVDRLVSQFSGSSTDIEASVLDLLTQLEGEELVARQLSGVSANGSGHEAPAELNVENGKPAFQGFSFQKYTDLNHLLLLDPIHDANETGWPDVKAGTLA